MPIDEIFLISLVEFDLRDVGWRKGFRKIFGEVAVIFVKEAHVTEDKGKG